MTRPTDATSPDDDVARWVRETRNPFVAVIGGANVDVKCVLTASAVMHTSNPGRSSSSLGGVARNIAENLARLRVRACLVTAVGDDAFGERVLSDTAKAGVNVRHALRFPQGTGTYTAVLDPSGELVIAVAAMSVMEELTRERLMDVRDVITAAAIVVVDCNVPEDALAFVLATCADADVPVLVEPVSVPKAARLRACLRRGARVTLATPNRDELSALTGMTVTSDAELLQATQCLRDAGVRGVWVRLGARGGLLCTPTGTHWIPAFPVPVVDVTGAGDASLAGFASALLSGHAPERAARYGHAAAALTITTHHTVHPDLSPEVLESLIEGADA